jgi:asparagine synthase (glutamine-hydrolysing)
LNPDRKTHYKSDAEYEQHFRTLLRQAVRRRLRTDSPVLAGLSGGYDSTSIVFTADDIIAREGAEAPRIDTFSYFDSKEPDDDDFIHVIKAEQKRGRAGFHCDMAGCGDSLCLEQERFVVAPGFGLREEIKPVLCDVVQRYGHRVGLSGLGGDEMTGQPLDCRVQAADMLVHLQLVETARHLVAWSLATRIPWIQLFYGSALELLPLPIRLAFAPRARLKSWINRDFANTYGIAARQLEVVNGGQAWKPATRDAVQTLATLSRLVTHASPSMVEQRYPYLDIDLVEFLASVPLDQLLRPGERRSLMRRSLAAVLPAETLSRKTKAAAARCYSVTLQKHWDKVDRLFNAPLSARFGYVEGDLVRQELQAMKSGQVQADFTRLLKALSLELWLRNVCDHGVLSVPAAIHSMRRGANTFSKKQIDWYPQALRPGNS